MSGRMANLSTVRKRFRKKLLYWGMDPKEVELCIVQIRERQFMKMRGEIPIDAPLCTRASYVHILRKNPNAGTGTAVLHLGEDYETPKDTGYKPAKVDPVLRGTARAVGQTAKAVKRKKTITKFQYDQESQ